MKAMSLPALMALLFYAPAGVADGSLMELLTLAKDHDAQYQAAVAEREAGEEAYPQARSVVLPTLSAGAAYNRVERDVRATPFSDRPTQDGGAGGAPGPTAPFSDRFDSQTWNVELRQPLFNWAIPATLSQGRAQADVAYLTFRTEYKLLLHRCATYYVQFLAAADRLRFSRAERKALAEDLETAQVRYEVGETAVTGLREAQAAFDLAETRVIEAERELNEQREELARLTGRWYMDLPSLVEQMPLDLPRPDTAEGWIDLANEKNSRILIAREQEEIAEDEISRRKSAFLPDLDLVASVSDTDQEDFVYGNASRDKALGVEATWTPFAGGRSLSELRESRARYRASLANRDVEVRDVHILVRNSFNLVRSSIRRINALDKALESANTALEATEAGFEVGERTQADVLAARRNRYQALTDRAEARYQYLSAVLNLKLYAGVLEEADLAQLARALIGPELPLTPEEPAATDRVPAGASAPVDSQKG